jgi:hypothetical protein
MALAEAKESGAMRIAGSIGPLVASYRADVMPPYDLLCRSSKKSRG